MIVVTGGAGFIGSHIVKALNNHGMNDIIVVDDLTDGIKFKNIVDCSIIDYWDKNLFLHKIQANQLDGMAITAVLHQGACTSTVEWNGQYLMENNYTYSKQVLEYCQRLEIPFIYASSAAVYGANIVCKEEPCYENPLNVYGYSKLIFDRHVRQHLNTASSQIVGLRYFNVFGANETHKGSMKSVAHHFYLELMNHDRITIFDTIPNCLPGEQRRDFVYVNDVVNTVLWFLKNPQHSGIFNLGTGTNENFNHIARHLIQRLGRGEIHYEPIPTSLSPIYQVNTKADITKLRQTGYSDPFKSITAAIDECFFKEGD